MQLYFHYSDSIYKYSKPTRTRYSNIQATRYPLNIRVLETAR